MAILGAGVSGLCMGIQLKKAGIESFTIFEKSERVGGTWWENVAVGARARRGQAERQDREDDLNRCEERCESASRSSSSRNAISIGSPSRRASRYKRHDRSRVTGSWCELEALPRRVPARSERVDSVAALCAPARSTSVTSPTSRRLRTRWVWSATLAGRLGYRLGCAAAHPVTACRTTMHVDCQTLARGPR